MADIDRRLSSWGMMTARPGPLSSDADRPRGGERLRGEPGEGGRTSRRGGARRSAGIKPGYLGEICRRVPREPARTLDEAVNCVWIVVWVALHMENTNTGLSMGRLDRWLQPYYEADMKQIRDEAGRRRM